MLLDDAFELARPETARPLSRRLLAITAIIQTRTAIAATTTIATSTTAIINMSGIVALLGGYFWQCTFVVCHCLITFVFYQ